MVWNREKAHKAIKNREDIIAANKTSQQTADKQFGEDCLAFIGETFNLNHIQASKVFSLSWTEGHASGYYEVLNWAQNLGELVNEVIAAAGKQRDNEHKFI